MVCLLVTLNQRKHFKSSVTAIGISWVSSSGCIWSFCARAPSFLQIEIYYWSQNCASLKDMHDNLSFCLIVEPYCHATSKSAKMAFIVWISWKNLMILRTYRTERSVPKIFSTNTCTVTPLLNIQTRDVQQRSSTRVFGRDSDDRSWKWWLWGKKNSDWL